MMRLWRHLLSVLILPFVVVVVVPVWISRSWAGLDTRWGETYLALVAHVLGAVIFLAGLGVFVWCVVLFARVGQGTLAPWDPTRRLVDVGPYRHARNPMISAVATMLAGTAVHLGSVVLAAWSALFIVVNHVYFVFLEEPGLERRFGAGYAGYKARVPRWLPRRRRRRTPDR
ncbi:MAG: methyltransferase family protein [Longimicrobiales bacterium]